MGASSCHCIATGQYAKEMIGDQNVFLSLQLTRSLEKVCTDWIGNTFPDAGVRASMPPFNNPQKIEVSSIMKAFDMPVFGPNIPKAVISILSHSEIRALAGHLNLKLPQNKLNTFVQSKMVKLHEMVKAAREEPTLAESQKAAIDKMESFTKEFEALTSADIPDMAAWDAFLLRHVESGWENKLHFDHVLGNFGFDPESARKLRQMHYVWPDGEKVPCEQHAIRWLSKIFAAYGPLGTMTDIVNLVFAMMTSSPTPSSQINETCVVDILGAFSEKLASKGFEGLWIPTHFAMDAEMDDCMCWVLLEHIHRAKGTQLRVLVQLPTDPAVDALADDLSKATGCNIFRDPDSQNGNAIKKYWIEQ